MSKTLNPELIERLAEAAHDVWMAGKVRDGWTYAAVTNKEQKQHSCLVPYTELSDGDKQSDRDLAVGIPEILEQAGYSLVSKPWLDAIKAEGLVT
jgi:hypothetical protein